MACLFISLSPATGKNALELRREIVAYLRTNPKLLDDLSAADVISLSDGKTLADYTNAMESMSTWGGALEIRAFTELYNTAVRVHVLYTGKNFLITNGRATRVMHITYTGTHFEPLILVDSNQILWQKPGTIVR